MLFSVIVTGRVILPNVKFCPSGKFVSLTDLFNVIVFVTVSVAPQAVCGRARRSVNNMESCRSFLKSGVGLSNSCLIMAIFFCY